MKAMAMGRAQAPRKRPEDADSWGEFHACLEREAADWGSPLVPLWWLVGVLCFVTALMSSAVALSSRQVLWWPWVCLLGSLALGGVLAARAVRRADERRTRRAQLIELEAAWLEHLARSSARTDEPGPGW
jgi:hypothetical protein